jgi:hypothetical protein
MTPTTARISTRALVVRSFVRAWRLMTRGTARAGPPAHHASMNRFQQSLPLALIALASCLPPHPQPAAPLRSADSVLMDLEERLLTASTFRLRYRVEAAGAVTAKLDGELFLGPEDVVELTASGIFAGAPVQLHLRAAGGRMTGGSEQRSFEGATPDHLRTALVLGLTRMGILHNLGRLNGGRPPDHADGGAGEWVVPREVTWLGVTEGNDSPRGVRFAIEVAGARTAEASLWMDREGWPQRRTQTVQFPGGEMRVTEEYEIIRALGVALGVSH